MQIFTTYNYNTNLNFQQRLSASARKAYEPKVVALYKQNIKPQEIVKILKVSKDFVRNVIQKYSLKRPTRIKQDEVSNMLDEISPEKIQEIFQCPISKANSIYSKVKENIRITRRKQICEEIMSLKSTGLSDNEIAQKLGRTLQNVRGYIRYYEEKLKNIE